MPAPPPGASPPVRWSDEAYLRTLLGDGVRDLHTSLGSARFAVTDSPAAFRDWWKQRYGPIVTTYARIADAPERTAELDTAFLDHLTATRTGDHWESEYLLVTAVRL